MIHNWETYSPSKSRGEATARLTITRTGLYLNRIAAMLLPKNTEYVLVRHDPFHFRLRVERCRKDAENALKLQGEVGKQRRVSGVGFNAWAVQRAGRSAQFMARPLDGGIEVDLKAPTDGSNP